MEFATPRYYHVAPSVIASLDRVQRRLLRELGLGGVTASDLFNLAPLQSRRGMDMLGLLHRISMHAALQLQILFPFAPPVNPLRIPTRVGIQRHGRQFVVPFYHTDVLGRGIFGLAKIYNLLRGRVVKLKTVKKFQSALQTALRRVVALTIGPSFVPPPPTPSVHALQFQELFE